MKILKPLSLLFLLTGCSLTPSISSVTSSESSLTSQSSAFSSEKSLIPSDSSSYHSSEQYSSDTSISSETISSKISSNIPSSESISSSAIISSSESSALPSSSEPLISSEASSQVPSSEAPISSEVSSQSSSSGSEEIDFEQLFYDDFYEPSNDISITIMMSDEHLERLCEYGSPYSVTTHDIYHPCDTIVTINGKSYEFPETGLRIKGNMSRGDSSNFFSNGQINGHAHFKLSFSTTFNDNPNYEPTTDTSILKARRFGKAKKIDLKWNRNYDNTFTKEAYASYMFEQEDMMAQKINLVKVNFISDHDSKTYIYQALECVDQQFLNKRLSKAEAKGDLYKCGWVNSDNASLTSISTNLMGTEDCTKNEFYVYDLKTNEDTSNHEHLISLINSLNTYDQYADENTLKNRIEKVVDIDYFLRFAALEWLVGNPDSLRYNYNNTYLYFNSGNDLLYPIMFDNDRVFGITHDWPMLPTRWPTTSKSVGGDFSELQRNPLYQRTVCAASNEHPMLKEYQDRYLAYIKTYMDKYLDVNKFNQFTSEFVNKDNSYDDNLSFASYCNEMIASYNNCIENR